MKVVFGERFTEFAKCKQGRVVLGKVFVQWIRCGVYKIIYVWDEKRMTATRQQNTCFYGFVNGCSSRLHEIVEFNSAFGWKIIQSAKRRMSAMRFRRVGVVALIATSHVQASKANATMMKWQNDTFSGKWNFGLRIAVMIIEHFGDIFDRLRNLVIVLNVPSIHCIGHLRRSVDLESGRKTATLSETTSVKLGFYEHDINHMP